MMNTKRKMLKMGKKKKLKINVNKKLYFREISLCGISRIF